MISGAASLLPGTGFIGFGSFTSGSNVSNESTSKNEDIDLKNEPIDKEFELVFKALSKKDPITKVKALNELITKLKILNLQSPSTTLIFKQWV